MKKGVVVQVLLWLVIFSGSAFAGEVNWSQKVSNTDVNTVVSTLSDGSHVVVYVEPLQTNIVVYSNDHDSAKTKTLSIVNERNGSWNLGTAGVKCSVENGQDFIYLYGMISWGVSSFKGFVYKYNTSLDPVWKEYLDDFYIISKLEVVNNSYLFAIGNNQQSGTKKISWTKVFFDKSRGYTTYSDVLGYALDTILDGNNAIIAGYESGETGKIVRVEFTTGNFLEVKTYEDAGTHVSFNKIKKVPIGGYVISGDDGPFSTDNNVLFRMDSSFNIVNTKRFATEVDLCDNDGSSFIVRLGIYNGACDYQIVDSNGNTIKTLDMMTDSYGQVVKSGDSYYGAGRMTDGTGIWAYFYKPNLAPTTNAGTDQTIAEGATVNLSGTGNDPDGDALVYTWVQLYGPTVALIMATAQNVSFVAPTVGPEGAALGFQFTASDGTISITDTCIINITNINQAPTANAGTDQTVTEGVVVSLTGSGNDPDGNAITYHWTQISGPTVTLNNATSANPSFTTPDVGHSGAALGFQLTVSDGTLTATDTCVVNVTFSNQAPTANAGTNQTVTEGVVVSLTGTGNDPDGDAITYQWTQISGPTVTLNNATSSNPSFTSPDVDNNGASLGFQLTVSDGTLTATDTCVVNVTFDNQVPTANAGIDQTVNEKTTVNLSGSGNDPDGDSISYLWTQISGPIVTLMNATSVNPSFTAPDVDSNGATLVFRLTTSDGTLVATDTCMVTVGNVIDDENDPDPEDPSTPTETKSDSGGGGGACFINSLM